MHRTQRWEAHIWQEGKQIYLGGFDAEEQAALAYDLAALKFRGPDAQINFDISNYEQELLHFNDVEPLLCARIACWTSLYLWQAFPSFPTWAAIEDSGGFCVCLGR